MAIDLYYTPGSAPCRLVLLVAAALDIKLNLNLVDLGAGDQFKSDFLKVTLIEYELLNQIKKKRFLKTLFIISIYLGTYP